MSVLLCIQTEFHRAVLSSCVEFVQRSEWRRSMFVKPAASWYHSNQYHEQAACEHCGGVVRHEKWCIPCDPLVRYAYGAVLDSGTLTLRDRLILHALGVSWQENSCQGSCQKTVGS